jgi:ABC-2 type transport system permease protein
VFARSLTKLARRPVLLTFSFVQPLWWMALFGSLFGQLVARERLTTHDYLSFVAPGVSLLSVLFGASQAGIAYVRDAQSGMLARMLQTRTSALTQLLGKLLAEWLRLLAMALAVLGLGALLGAELTPNLAALPSAVLAVSLFASLAVALSCAVACLTREPEAMASYVHVINMPVLFSSSALVPDRAQPRWLAGLSQHNPLSYAAEGWRALWLGSAPVEPRALLELALMTGAALALCWLALVRARNHA